MRTTTPILCALALLSLCFSCDKYAPAPLADNIGDQAIDFSNLRIGQRSTYVLYEAHCNQDQAEVYSYEDTLILEVLGGEEPGTFQLRESISSVFHPIYYPVDNLSAEGLHLPERENSALFFFYGADHLQFKFPAGFEGLPLRQEDCRLYTPLGPFVGEEIGQIDSLDFGDILLTDKRVVSCVPIVYDLEAYLIYDENQLHMSYTIFEEVFGMDTTYRAMAWRLLEE
ncbi:hypothetical protein [Flavilitoribacter nigricans]|uniref:Uncharacterized protein n=1 Tax=Flavilitoribacter nigricans (strain ATCC 23147 / DSM 23189 / NBRC 102662 / NCIMB 1420 / SS-2) TaxID=1122177 RepID=A0A2D0NIW5_FLAN2|nr:hypothetical protein [Flavilitoribacter nigricans]PHN08445.1 hypothetical protein CRP01_00600 [Flavilitoribacter nigricans DSM 23189 = NBRC 102662]